MKSTILLSSFLVIVGCSNLPTSTSSDEDETTMHPQPSSNCCAHWTGSNCAHELIPGCSNTTSPSDPIVPFNSSNCAHIGADGTCLHPL